MYNLIRFAPNACYDAIDKKSTMVQLMSRHIWGNKPLPWPVMTQFDEVYVLYKEHMNYFK